MQEALSFQLSFQVADLSSNELCSLGCPTQGQLGRPPDPLPCSLESLGQRAAVLSSSMKLQRWVVAPCFSLRVVFLTADGEGAGCSGPFDGRRQGCAAESGTGNLKTFIRCHRCFFGSRKSQLTSEAGSDDRALPPSSYIHAGRY